MYEEEVVVGIVLSSYNIAPKIFYFFFNDTATTEIYTLSLHDALPILRCGGHEDDVAQRRLGLGARLAVALHGLDRKSTRLNSSHANISYAVFCLKKNTASENEILCPTLYFMYSHRQAHTRITKRPTTT